MNRQEFMERLRVLLGDLPEEEREEALQYYEDYFEDAGYGMEEAVIRELGSPEKVALMIRESIRGEETGAEFAETGYYETRYDDRKMPADYIGRKRDDGKYEDFREEQKPWTSRRLKVILIILIICVGFSTVVPAIGGIILGIIGAIAGLFGIFFAFVLAAFCIAAVGIGLVSVGIPLMVSSLAAGIFLCGTGLILLALGILGTVFGIRLCKVMIPAIFRGVVAVVQKVLFRERAGA